MSEKYALFDTDFISKMHRIQKNAENHLIDRILELPSCKFFCHSQILVELGRHPKEPLMWLKNEIQKGTIVCYSDQEILNILSQYYGGASCAIFTRMLKDSCEAFKAGNFSKMYGDLSNMDFSTISIEEYLSKLDQLEIAMGIQNNLGEIKTFVLQQILSILFGERVYVFCSDDNGARQGAVAFEDTRCISVLSSFVRLKNELSFDLEKAAPYIASWLEYCSSEGQKTFRVEEAKKNPRQIPRMLRLPCQQVMDEIYEDRFVELKNGMLRYKELS